MVTARRMTHSASKRALRPYKNLGPSSQVLSLLAYFPDVPEDRFELVADAEDIVLDTAYLWISRKQVTVRGTHRMKAGTPAITFVRCAEMPDWFYLQGERCSCAEHQQLGACPHMQQE